MQQQLPIIIVDLTLENKYRYRFTYEMKQNISTNGFLHCIENGKQLCFKFIDVNNNSIIKNNCNSNSFDRYSRKSKSNKNSKLPKTIGGKKRRTIKTNNIKTI
jgi:hypothetical protein